MADNLLDLTKKLELCLTKANVTTIPTLATHLAVDCSGSMSDEFREGYVQHIVNLFLAAAMKFDDDGELQVGTFNTRFRSHRPATKEDLNSYVSKERLYADGGTKYAPIWEDFVLPYQREMSAQPSSGGMLSKIFGKSKPAEKPKARGYFCMITDGDNDDRREFEASLAKMEADQVFIQVIALGTQVNVNYLSSIATEYDNVSFIQLKQPKKVTDESFYESLCNPKFTKWTSLV